MKYRSYLPLVVPVVCFLLGTLSTDILAKSSTDATPPEPGLVLSRIAFSPDGDGRADTVLLHPVHMTDGSVYPQDWTLKIYDANGNVMRSYRADRRLIRPERSWRNAYLPGRLAVAPLKLFDSLLWDGRDSAGKRVVDGIYSMELTVRNGRSGMEQTFPPVRVAVRTSKPVLTLGADRYLILRPGPGKKGEHVLPSLNRVEILQKAVYGAPLAYRGIIQNGHGDVIRRYRWDDVLPAVLEWDGTDEKGRPVAPGNYSYSLSARDGAGNRSQAQFNEILISPEPLLMDLQRDEVRFSPDCNGDMDRITIHPIALADNLKRLPDWRKKLGIRYWRFDVMDAKGEKVLYSDLKPAPLPDQLVWDGRNVEGEILPSDPYRIRLVLDSEYGVVASYARRIWLDTRPPATSLSISGGLLSPDGDEDGEWTTLRLRAEDPGGIRHWKLTISYLPDLEKSFNLLKKIHRVFEGDGPPPSHIFWDGRGDDGSLPESRERFEIQFEAVDRAGNVGRIHPEMLQTDILLRPEFPGGSALIVRLPDQRYFNADNSLTKEGEKALDHFVSRLARYGKYFLHAESHSSLKGDETANLKKTEARALSVYRYLLRRGIAADRLDYRGMGESEPLAPETDEFNRYRNDRIQFRLEAK